MDYSQKEANLLTVIGTALGGLSLTDKVTFLAGLIVLILAGMSNYMSYKKHKEELRQIRKKTEEDERQNS